jgi:hypothetical protein
MLGRKKRAKRNKSAQGTSTTSSWVAHLIINKVKRSDNQREAKTQDGHTVVADSLMILCRALMLETLVMVHAGRGKREGVCAVYVVIRSRVTRPIFVGKR